MQVGFVVTERADISTASPDRDRRLAQDDRQSRKIAVEWSEYIATPVRVVRSKSEWGRFVMWRKFAAAAAVLGCLAMPALASPDSAKSRYMRVFGTTPPPYGFVQFCQSHAHECNDTTTSSERFSATPDRLAQLDRINRMVNAAITPATDAEIFGVNEFWTMPVRRGDCEDYVIMKRRVLIEQGWPPSALLITVVLDEVGDGHAVLTVRTSQGDFILDNKVDDVKPWKETPYTFLMRQSYLNARVWMALDPSVGQGAHHSSVTATN
jgi:predicted transglutaminase-like cysteine proteinase